MCTTLLLYCPWTPTRHAWLLRERNLLYSLLCPYYYLAHTTFTDYIYLPDTVLDISHILTHLTGIIPMLLLKRQAFRGQGFGGGKARSCWAKGWSLCPENLEGSWGEVKQEAITWKIQGMSDVKKQKLAFIVCLEAWSRNAYNYGEGFGRQGRPAENSWQLPTSHTNMAHLFRVFFLTFYYGKSQTYTLVLIEWTFISRTNH